MNPFRWIKNRIYAPALVADNAITQYHKAKDKNLSDSPKEIAAFLWDWRYANAVLNHQKRERLERYIESDFPIETMVDFCFGTLDIEILVSPVRADAFNHAAEYIVKELVKGNIPCRTYQFATDDTDDAFDADGIFKPDDMASFIEKWFRLVSPLRLQSKYSQNLI